MSAVTPNEQERMAVRTRPAASPVMFMQWRDLLFLHWEYPVAAIQATLPDGLPVGQAVATVAGNLACRWVVHTVGPNRHAGETDPALLAACFSNSLAVCRELGARSVAFPAVSAGVYGWAAEDVARIAVAAIRADARADPGAGEVDLVRFVLFSQPLLRAFEDALSR